MSKSIVKACVRYNDRLYTGFDHGECFKKLNEDNIIEQSTFTKIVHSEIEQGFVDNYGNFVDRKEAMIIAKESGQLTYETDKQTLISEDLHLNWLNNQTERIAELEAQLKNAIRFKTPQIERFAVVQYIHWEKKPYKIVNCFDAYKDENMKTRYCFYGVPSTNFKVIQICDTKEEAQAKLKELTAKNV